VVERQATLFKGWSQDDVAALLQTFLAFRIDRLFELELEFVVCLHRDGSIGRIK
jgi:hypothetical protein